MRSPRSSRRGLEHWNDNDKGAADEGLRESKNGDASGRGDPSQLGEAVTYVPDHSDSALSGSALNGSATKAERGLSETARLWRERAARPRKPAASAIESSASASTSTLPASRGPASAPEFSKTAAIAFDEVSSEAQYGARPEAEARRRWFQLCHSATFSGALSPRRSPKIRRRPTQQTVIAWVRPMPVIGSLARTVAPDLPACDYAGGFRVIPAPPSRKPGARSASYRPRAGSGGCERYVTRPRPASISDRAMRSLASSAGVRRAGAPLGPRRRFPCVRRARRLSR